MPIRCQICGCEFHTITPAHLKTHWTTIKAYRIIYPNALLRDQETCDKISAAHKGKAKSPEHRAKLTKLNKERANDPAWIAMITEAQRARRKREASLPLAQSPE